MSPLVILLVALLIVVGGTLLLRLHPFLTLVVAAFAVAALTPSGAKGFVAPGQLVAEGFGKAALDIGIVIAMASILGTCLSAAGAAERIVVSIQWAVGEARTPLALLLTGFVLGIPMFAETVFYLLLPLARANWQRTGGQYLLCVLAIVAGATMTHSLVPPTPGPLFVADALSVDMATMIGCGLVVGLVAALAGLAYARWSDRRWPLEPQPAGGSSEVAAAPLPHHRLPAVWAAIVPILLPVALISLASAVEVAPKLVPPWSLGAIRVLGEKNLAVSSGAIAAMLVLAASGGDLAAIRRTVGEAVTEAGGIILVIAAGGALGGCLRQAGLAQLASGLAAGGGLALIPIAWAITAVIRVAQGSATVAMITAAGIMAPIVADAAASFHPVYVALAIGCGSKIGMWMNDSGFWVIARMSGMSEPQTLRSASAMVTIEGTVGLLATLAMALAFPLR